MTAPFSTPASVPTARVWDASSGTLLCPLLTFEAIASTAQLSRDGRRLAVGVGRQVHLCNVAGGERIGQPIPAGDLVQQLAFSPDAGRLLIATRANVITPASRVGARVWDVATGKPITPLFHNSPQGVASAVFSPDGKRIFAASYDGIAGVWEADTGKAVNFSTGQPNISYGTFSPDSRWLATASRDWSGRVWNAETGTPITPTSPNT
jgi:WD40 repeat protein